MNKTTEPAAPDLSRIEPIDYVYRGSDGLIYRTVPQHVPVIETIPRYSAATVERLVQERDRLQTIELDLQMAVQKLAASQAEVIRLNGVCSEYRQTQEAMFGDLAASQAREQQLREALKALQQGFPQTHQINAVIRHTIALPQDDTALRQWGAKLLEESANESEAEGWMSITLSALRRKATKLREGKK